MTRLYGLTDDGSQPLAKVMGVLNTLPVRATVRIVCDPGTRPIDYRERVLQISSKADVMLQPVDSAGVKDYSLRAYKKRFQDFIGEFHTQVQCVECGNEVNGDWLGRGVFAKVSAALEIARQYRLKTAVTYYLERDNPRQMFEWARANPLKATYSLVSFYPFSTEVQHPGRGWQGILEFWLRRMLIDFPDSLIGIGEYGTQDGDATLGSAVDEIALIRQYERVRLDSERYIAGCFAWNALARWPAVGAVYREVWGKK